MTVRGAASSRIEDRPRGERLAPDLVHRGTAYNAEALCIWPASARIYTFRVKQSACPCHGLPPSPGDPAYAGRGYGAATPALVAPRFCSFLIAAGSRVALAVVLAAVMATCGGRIWADQEGPQGIRLHWYTRETSIDAATRRAAEHCQNWGKHTVLLEEFTDADVTVARFACR